MQRSGNKKYEPCARHRLNGRGKEPLCAQLFQICRPLKESRLQATHSTEKYLAKGDLTMKFLVLNGPNLNMLGIREPDIYGKQDYAALETFIRESAGEADVQVDIFQSNHEGVLVDRIQQALHVYDGIIINPAAYTHTSIAILDALKAVALPAVEVHLSDISAREGFRRISYAGMACLKTFAGLGFEGYRKGILFLKGILEGENERGI